MFRVECLGASQVSRSDGSQVHFRSRKHFAVLAYLAMTGPRAHRRERLVGMLWPEDGDAKARHSLSQALYALRRLFGEDVVEVRGEEVQIGSGRPAVDALEFEQHLRRGELAPAVALYRGEFLEGFWIREARPFEEWMDRERARLSAELRQALRTLIRTSRDRGEWGVVMERTRRLIQLEPYDEHAHADLMRALWIVGDRAGALKQYEILRDVLASDLEAEPGQEIRELAARIRRRTAEAKRKQSERKAEPVLSEPPFVGRKEEYARLVEVWRQVREGHADGVVLTGEPGIGKTRLAEEFLKYVATEDALVLRGACYPFLQGVPYAPFAEALRPLTELERHVRSIEPRWQSELLRLFPELVGRSRPEVGPNDHQSSALRLQFEAVAQLFQRLCADRPLVFLLDNLQWSDVGSSCLAYFILQRWPKLPILLVATSREERSGQWLTWPVDAESRVQPLRVPPLSREDMGRLVAQLSAGIVTEEVYVLSRGNPFFALQLCSAALGQRSEGIESQADSGRPVADVQDARSIVERRLGLLRAQDQRILEVGSVIGPPVHLSLLQAVAGVDRDAVVEAVERLGASGFVVCVGEHLEFAHDLIHEAVYGRLPEVRRRILHARVAATLEGVKEESAEALAKVAWHYDRAGDRVRAFAAAMEAAEAARERHAYNQAQLLGEVAVRNAATPPQRLAASQLVGEALVWQRRYSEAHPFLQEAQALAIEMKDYEGQLAVQYLLWRTELDGLRESAADVLERAERVASEPWIELVSPRTRLRLIGILLGAGYRQGDLAALSRAAQLAEKWGQDSQDPIEVSLVLRARGMYEVLAGHYDEGLPLLEKRVELVSQAGSLVEQINALLDMGVALTLAFTSCEAALVFFSQALAMSQELGDPLVQAHCHNNSGSALLDWGHFESACSHLVRARDILEPHSDLTDELCVVECNLGELHWLMRERYAAQRHWKRANRLAESRPVLWLNSTAGLGLCALADGDKQAAREYCAEALRTLRNYKGLHAEFQDPFLLSVSLRLADGRLKAATRMFERAADRLRNWSPASYLKLLWGAGQLLQHTVKYKALDIAETLLDFATSRGVTFFEEEASRLIKVLRAD